jgi:hypothetical protein
MSGSDAVPPSGKALLVCVVLLLIWSAIHIAIGYRLEDAARAERELSPFEHVIVSADSWMIRWLPYGFLPVILAPEVAIGLWAMRTRRASYSPPPAHLTRAHLRTWAILLGAAVALGVAAQVCMMRLQSHSGILFLATALFAFEWAYAGSLWATLWLQAARNQSGLSRVKASHLALTSFLVAACAPLHLLGAAIPVGVLWTSREGS